MSSIQFVQFPINGEPNVELLDPDFLSPSETLDRSKPYYIDVEWTLRGAGVDTLGGKWTVTAYFQALGAATPNPGPISSGPFAMNLTADGVHLKDEEDVRLTVPPNHFPAPGIYEMVTYISHSNGNVPQPTAMVGSTDPINLTVY
jgi:hypothetical protein